MYRSYYPKDLKPFLLSAFLILTTFANFLHAGTVELYHIKTTGDKSIILRGDNHSICNTDEIFSTIELIKEQDQAAKSVVLLIEEPLTNEYSLCNASLSNFLPMYSYEKTKIKNVEIRAVSTAVITLLNPDTNLSYLTENSFFQNGSSKRFYVASITFQHVYDEYGHLRQALSEQYQKYDDLPIQQLFTQEVDKVEEHYGKLKFLFNKWKDKYGIEENESILSLIKKIKGAEQVKLTKKMDENKKRIALSRKLMNHIFKVFIPLFDINAFDYIAQEKKSSDIILLDIGYLHARTIKDWLVAGGDTLCQSLINKSSDSSVTTYDMVNEFTNILNTVNPSMS